MNVDDDLFLSAVEAIYDAAAEPRTWQVALDFIAKCVGAVGAALQDQCEDQTFAMIASPGIQQATRLYLESWWQQDIGAIRTIERGLLLTRGHVTDFDLATAEEMASHPIYRDFLPSVGLGYSMAVAVRPSSNVVLALGLQRATGAPAFTMAEMEIVKRLARYAEKSLRLSMGLFDAKVVGSLLAGTMSRLGVGVVLLDDEARTTFVTSAAERAMGRGLRLANGRLSARIGDDQTRLDALINTTIRGQPVPPGLEPRVILLHNSRPGEEERPPLAVHVLPVADSTLGGTLASFRSSTRALVLTMDQGEERSFSPDTVRAVFGLTPGQARLAALVAGGDAPKSAAERLDITTGTSRVVLRKVFAAMHVGSQRELAALIGAVLLRDR